MAALYLIHRGHSKHARKRSYLVPDSHALSRLEIGISERMSCLVPKTLFLPMYVLKFARAPTYCFSERKVSCSWGFLKEILQ